jgi:cytoskeletal protein RodZ
MITTTSPLSLASERKRKGMDLEEIARSTRIAPRYLQAIEAEEFNQLPGGVYDTSYIRQYARAIGYSESALLERYYVQTRPEPGTAVQAEEDGRVTTRLGEMIESLRWGPNSGLTILPSWLLLDLLGLTYPAA